MVSCRARTCASGSGPARPGDPGRAGGARQGTADIAASRSAPAGERAPRLRGTSMPDGSNATPFPCWWMGRPAASSVSGTVVTGGGRKRSGSSRTTGSGRYRTKRRSSPGDLLPAGSRDRSALHRGTASEGRPSPFPVVPRGHLLGMSAPRQFRSCAWSGSAGRQPPEGLDGGGGLEVAGSASPSRDGAASPVPAEAAVRADRLRAARAPAPGHGRGRDPASRTPSSCVETPRIPLVPVPALRFLAAVDAAGPAAATVPSAPGGDRPAAAREGVAGQDTCFA